MKFKKIAMISAASLMLISTCSTVLRSNTQTTLAAKKTKSKKEKSQEKEIFNDMKETLYSGHYSGPKPNRKLEKILKKFSKNTHDNGIDGYTVHFRAKRDTTAYYDATNYENYDENGDPINPNQLGTQKIKKGETLNLFYPYLDLTKEPFLGRDIFKNKTILVGSIYETNDEERYYYMDDFSVIKK